MDAAPGIQSKPAISCSDIDDPPAPADIKVAAPRSSYGREAPGSIDVFEQLTKDVRIITLSKEEVVARLTITRTNTSQRSRVLLRRLQVSCYTRTEPASVVRDGRSTGPANSSVEIHREGIERGRTSQTHATLHLHVLRKAMKVERWSLIETTGDRYRGSGHTACPVRAGEKEEKH